MGTFLNDGRWFAPLYGWTRADYDSAVARRETPSGDSPAGESSALDCTASESPVAVFLAAVGRAPAWQRDALCKEYPDVSFFPELGEPSAPAKAVCARCLVRVECAAAGSGEKGVWGGLSEKERRQARRATAA